jgi:hypothetical protein
MTASGRGDIGRPRTAVNRFGVNVNQAVTKFHATAEPPMDALGHAVALCMRR